MCACMCVPMHVSMHQGESNVAVFVCFIEDTRPLLFLGFHSSSKLATKADKLPSKFKKGTHPRNRFL